jgi:hypothetical protein
MVCGSCLCTERIRNEAYGHGDGSLIRISPLKHSTASPDATINGMPVVSEASAPGSERRRWNDSFRLRTSRETNQ